MNSIKTSANHPQHQILNSPIRAAHLTVEYLARRMRAYIPADTRSEMMVKSSSKLTFARLPDIPPEEIIAHMSDPRVAEHMPLLTYEWDSERLAAFVSAKEERWRRDGLGHWAILCDGAYVGWGGFQKEGEEWDFGLVLKPDSFGLGMRIARQALAFARKDERIPFVTFLLPPSRKNLGALARLGARFVEEIEYNGARFRKYRMETERPLRP